MAHRDPSFAPPLHELAPLRVAAAPTRGQGLSLDEKGKLPESVFSLAKFTKSASMDTIVESLVSGDSHSRVEIDAAGKIEWGSGAAAADVNLYRSSADTLTTDDTFEALRLALSDTAPRIQFDETDTTKQWFLVLDGSNISFREDSTSGSNRRLEFYGTPASGNTAIKLSYHNGTAVTLQTVSLGAADSGGTGFKVLRVPN